MGLCMMHLPCPAQDEPVELESIELAQPPVLAILSAPLADREDTPVLVNETNPEENGRLLSLDGSATTKTFARTLPALVPKGGAGAEAAVPCLLLPNARSHLVFPIPKRFRQDRGALEFVWQPVSGTEEFGALFCSDTDTAFQAFFAEGSLHFRVAGGQVSCVHQPRPGARHRYRFLWDRSEGRRAIYIDGECAVDEKGAAWRKVAVGKELFFNARANLAFPGRGGAPGYYGRIALYDVALEPEAPAETPAPPQTDGEDNP